MLHIFIQFHFIHFTMSIEISQFSYINRHRHSIVAYQSGFRLSYPNVQFHIGLNGDSKNILQI